MQLNLKQLTQSCLILLTKRSFSQKTQLLQDFPSNMEFEFICKSGQVLHFSIPNGTLTAALLFRCRNSLRKGFKECCFKTNPYIYF